MSESQDQFKVRVKTWMREYNISRNEMAAKCFVSPNTFRNWMARVSIPQDKQALIQYIMEKSAWNAELKKSARGDWKPFAVMVSEEDYSTIKDAAALKGMTVEEWAEEVLIQDANTNMNNMEKKKSATLQRTMDDPAPLAAETPEEYGSRRSSSSNSSSSDSSSSGPDSPRRRPRR